MSPPEITARVVALLGQANPAAIAWASKRAGDLIVQIQKTTKDRIRALVVKAEAEGWSNDNLADAIDAAGIFDERRASMIARTETAFADVQGNVIGWKASGVVAAKEWIVGTAESPDVPCEHCEEYDGSVVGLDEEFPEGDPPLHPNCRCDVLPVLTPGLMLSDQERDDQLWPRKAESARDLSKGEGPGHPFRGNQYVDGRGGDGSSIKPARGRAWNGEPAEIAATLSKPEIGALGERLAVSVLKAQGAKGVRVLHDTASHNFPVDLVDDRHVYEVKTGIASSGTPRWRITIGQPGKAEAEWLASADPEDKAEWNEQKVQAAIARKEQVLRQFSKQSGRRLRGKTIGIILNPDTRVADVHLIDGFHANIAWRSAAAREGYIGSFRYA